LVTSSEVFPPVELEVEDARAGALAIGEVAQALAHGSCGKASDERR